MGGGWMSHYFELLTANQPWNLLIYMIIPLGLVVCVAVSELFVLYRKETHGFFKYLNMASGYAATLFFSWVFATLLMSTWVPKTLVPSPSWNGLLDFLSFTFYLGCIFPLWGMALTDLPWVDIRKRPERRLLIHACFLALLLIFYALSLALGFLNPSTLPVKGL